MSATLNLASIYSRGLDGIEENVQLAIKYTEMAGNLGHSPSLIHLSRYYKKGKGVEMDLEKHFELYRHSAELGNCAANRYLVNAYLLGRDREIDVDKAIVYAQKLKLLGENNSLLKIAVTLIYGEKIEKDEERGLEILVNLGESGSVTAFKYLGDYYDDEGKRNFSFFFININ